MDKLKIVGVGAVVAFIVALAVTYFNVPGTQIVKETIRERIGATPGPEGGPDYQCYGDVCEAYRSGTCQNATTSLFLVQNPFGAATSVLVYSDVRGHVGTSSLNLMIGTSTAGTGANNFPSGVSATNTLATSTDFVRIGPFRDSFGLNTYVSSSGSAEVVATGSPAIIGPNQFVAGNATGSNTGSTFDGVGGLLGDNNVSTCTYRLKFIR